MLNLIRRIREVKAKSYNRGYNRAVAVYARELKHRDRAHSNSIKELAKAQENELKSMARLRAQMQKQLEKRDQRLFQLLDRCNQVEAHERQMKTAFDKSLKELAVAAASSNEIETIRQDGIRAASDF